MHFIIFSFYQPVATGSYILYNNFSYKHQNIRKFSHFTCFAGRSVIIMYVVGPPNRLVSSDLVKSWGGGSVVVEVLGASTRVGHRSVHRHSDT